MNYFGQKWSCCQLISALNALIYHKGEVPNYNEEYLNYLADLVKCKDGAAVNIELAHKELGLNCQYIPYNLAHILDAVCQGHCVEVALHNMYSGSHSVLVISHYSNIVRIVNWKPDEVVSNINITEFDACLWRAHLSVAKARILYP